MERAALNTLSGLDKPTRRRLWDRIRALADDPRPHGPRALQGDWSGHYRIRVGSYRILYTIRDRELLVSVVRVGERQRVYR